MDIREERAKAYQESIPFGAQSTSGATASNYSGGTITATGSIFSARIQALYRHTPMVLTVNIVNSGFVAWVLASYLGQSSWWLFFVLSAFLSVARTICWIYYRHNRTSGKQTLWAAFATIGSALSGLLWGGSSLFLLPENVVEQTFVAFVIGGICAGAVVSLSYYLPAFIAYVYLSVLPLACGFLLAGGTLYVAMGSMALVFAAFVTFAAQHFNRSFVKGSRLNLDVSERTYELTKRTEQLIAVNSQLQAEIAQRQEAENRLHQAQKMEALGQLTGGIAHDFNNLLTAVIGNLELLQKLSGSDANFARPLNAALTAAERGATLIQDLLTFARRKTLLPRAVDISAVVDDAEKILKQTIGPHIRLVIHTAPDLNPAWVDPDQLGLAIVNLALNARDAMPRGGTLQITGENRRVEISGATTDLPAGDYVTIMVSDNGTGMSEATLARAFEPFFTTKPAGRGSGMGLSTAQGFAAQSGGMLRVLSSLGRGTTVEIWLPPAKRGALATAAVQPTDYVIDQRRARILVCDDDGDVRSVVAAQLRDLGHAVWEACDPLVALQILERETPVDLLLADYAMPDMNGRELINRATAFQPELKTLLMTGYVEALRQNGVVGLRILSKPFKAAELRKVVGEVLSDFAHINIGQHSKTIH